MDSENRNTEWESDETDRNEALEATEEQIQDFIRQSSLKGRCRMEDEQEDPLRQLNQFVHPYFDEEPDLGKSKYEPCKYISRGCESKPEAYRTVDRRETDSCAKLNVHDWLKDVVSPKSKEEETFVEVRFKNSRKEFFRLPEGLEICEGDIVAVEGTPGHDIGIVSLTGELCKIQMRKKNVRNFDQLKKLYRRAKVSDVEKWLQSIEREDAMLFETRVLIDRHGLSMKLNDIELQGDGTKAVFYYTADERVDFRQLIKSLAEQFRIRIEMKQIGARQEASRLGGIGTCGRELCCSTWINCFHSVSTSVAKTQQLFPNPQKLAGQCGKLKCCLNYEYDVYVDALNSFPELGVELRTKKGDAVYHKADMFKSLMWYSYKDSSQLIPLSVKDVKYIVSENRRNRLVEDLESFEQKEEK